MKIKKISICCLAGVASLCFMGLKNNKNNLRAELALSNIEALAMDETGVYLRCIGIGSLDCPEKSVKVAYIGKF